MRIPTPAKLFLSITSLTLLVTLGASPYARAEGSPPASDRENSIVNSSGKSVALRFRGNAFYSWYEDKDGYTVVSVSEPNPQGGRPFARFHYAALTKDGDLIPLGAGHKMAEVGNLDPTDVVRRGLVPSPEAIERSRNGERKPSPAIRRSGFFYYAFWTADGKQIEIADAPLHCDLDKMGLILRQQPVPPPDRK